MSTSDSRKFALASASTDQSVKKSSGASSSPITECTMPIASPRNFHNAWANRLGSTFDGDMLYVCDTALITKMSSIMKVLRGARCTTRRQPAPPIRRSEHSTSVSASPPARWVAARHHGPLGHQRGVVRDARALPAVGEHELVVVDGLEEPAHHR